MVTIAILSLNNIGMSPPSHIPVGLCINPKICVSALIGYLILTTITSPAVKVNYQQQLVHN
jgi:hypothetical protein